MTDADRPQRRAMARIAGALYLAIIVLGVAGEVLIRAPLRGDTAAETASAIAASESLVRIGLAGDAAMALCDAALAVLLFQLLRPAGPTLSLLALVFRLIQTSVIAGNLLLIEAAVRLSADDPALSSLAFDLHAIGYDLALLFFGMNALALAPLAMRSGWLPRALGPALAAAGAVYLVGSGLRLLAPAAVPLFAPAYAVPLLTETAFCLVLLFGAGPGGGNTDAAPPV